ncbi:MAG: tetratricopeptide repeat protein [Planctomycetes bacterium]|nr:tetratricopeptide repeat protein [Planctomycetota bacterium]
MDDINKALELNPASAHYYYRRGLIYYKKGNYKNAIADYTKAIELYPQYKDAYIDRCHIYAWLRDYKSAVADAEMLIKIDPNNTGADGVRRDIERWKKLLEGN